METRDKFCKDCLNFMPEVSGEGDSPSRYAHCRALMIETRRLVQGPSSDNPYNYVYCSEARKGPHCGPEGRLWEPRDRNYLCTLTTLA